MLEALIPNGRQAPAARVLLLAIAIMTVTVSNFEIHVSVHVSGNVLPRIPATPI